MNKNDDPVIVEETFKTDIQTVWNAITKVDLMRRWYFDNISSFKAEVGFETQFNVISQGRNFLHQWKVTEVLPMQKITYNWKFDSYPGDAYVTFELFEENNLTTLKLTNDVTESFPENIPEFTRESCISGWNYFIKKSLKEYVEKI